MKKLIFSNLINGNDVASIARAYEISSYEVEDIFRFVIRKITSYCFERAMPYIPCNTIDKARQHRIELLSLLEKINLESPPRYNRIVTKSIEMIL